MEAEDDEEDVVPSQKTSTTVAKKKKSRPPAYTKKRYKVKAGRRGAKARALKKATATSTTDV